MIRAVLFDATGTLIHLRESVGETYARMARPHGIEIAARHLDAAFSRAFRRMPPMAFSRVPREHIADLERTWWRELVLATFRDRRAIDRLADFDRYFDHVFAYYADPAAWVLAPNTRETLAELRRSGRRTGIVSNFDYRLGTILDGFGLGPLLDVVILPSDVGAAKPDPRIFTAAVERLRCEPGDALYVGNDADDDVAGACAAGLHAIDVASLPTLRAVVGRVESLESGVKSR
ncbi:MAG: hypothetical protein A3J75_05775 [Acidobacteria bacterium RBG_16_68_9]|nr:MAG: hypothetical protein A3J75_05775 [Acidobacteria bacterium RBG_16_68_9]